MLSARIRTSQVIASLLSAFLYIPAAAQHARIPQQQENAGVRQQQDAQVRQEQEAEVRQQNYASIRLASRQEGEGIVEAAWELRRGLTPKPDCSHFVNAVYSRAGLDYEYANTREMFAGIDSFRRVYHPQPGDLVVWPGHVGIVVDPDEHTFYSSVLSGFAIENYQSNYWAARGRPRFYRYLMDDAHSKRLLAHRDTIERPREAQSIPIRSFSNEHGAETRSKPRSRPAQSEDAVEGNAAHEGTAGNAAIANPIFVSSRPKPLNDEVRAALLRLADANAKRLLEHPRLRPNQTMVVAELVTVSEINLFNHSGWVELEVRDVTPTPVSTRPRTDDSTIDGWRVSFRRNERGWVLEPPQAFVYLRREAAIRVLADQVAALSRGQASNADIKRAVKALEDLLSKEIPGPTAGVQ